MAMDQTFRAMRASQPPVALKAKVGMLGTVAAEPQAQRTIFDAHQTQELPGEVVLSEGDTETSSDTTVMEAYDGLGATFDLFWEEFQRDSIDDEGMALNATVHFGRQYNNAFWDGERMVFGDGDGDLFNRFTIAIDIIGHELGHGVTEDEAQLVYFYQPGALNESMSDVFGSLVKQRVRGETSDQADWLIGAGLFTGAVQGTALRSMKAPGTAYDDPLLGKDPQPGHMRDYVRTFDDNGGVHINSGIPNRAFYLVATELGGYAWDKPARIWYETLRDSRLRRNSGFRRFASLTRSNAQKLFGANSPEAKAVEDAWRQVGIKISK
jgi:Zn-dependent metalloprotease